MHLSDTKVLNILKNLTDHQLVVLEAVDETIIMPPAGPAERSQSDGFVSDVDSAAVPLAATQDTSGSERRLPCPVLQPLAQPQVTFISSTSAALLPNR